MNYKVTGSKVKERKPPLTR